ncbi:MAG: hypothetical protein R3296_07020 [Oleiphilaceae bacterium]|nr:hypothetical protein [Oleiphilaceae bacterium]
MAFITAQVLLCLFIQPAAALDWHYQPGVDAPLLPREYRLPGDERLDPFEYTPPEWLAFKPPAEGLQWTGLSIGPTSEALDSQEERTAVALANQSVNQNLSSNHNLAAQELLPGPLQTPLTLDLGVRYEF